MKLKESISVFLITSFSGHGKDFPTIALEENLNKEIIKINFSEKTKEIVTKNLPEHFNLLHHNKNNKEIIEIYKNFETDKKFVINLNIRDFFKILMGDVIRNIEPSINLIFVLKEIEKNLLKNENTQFICLNAKYQDEKNTLLTLNKINNNIEKIEYIRNKIHECLKNIKTKTIIKNFEEQLINKTTEIHELIFFEKIMINLILELSILKKTIKPKKNNQKTYKFCNIKEMNYKEAIYNGVINIFKPIINFEVKSDLNHSDLIEELIKYNKISYDKACLYLKYYEKYKIKINAENIKKYGLIISNPLHNSEIESNFIKPDSMINNNFCNGNNIYLKLKKILNEEI